MTDDLEHGGKLKDRRSSWMMGRLTPSGIMNRSPSSASRITAPGTVNDGSQIYPLVSFLSLEELQKQDALISFIVDGEPIKGSLATACIWYTQYLQSKIQSQWSLLSTALMGLEDGSQSPKPGELVVVYNFIFIVAKLLKTRKDVALVEVVDELDNGNMLKEQLDEERAVPNQVVFAAMGWLTMLYEAVSHPKVDKLEVTKTSTSSSGMRNALNTRKYCTFRLGFDYVDLPLYSLLGRFGDLIPEAQPLHFYTPPTHGIRHSEFINVSSVCFNALHQLAELKIEWVTSLALHLELDSSKKTLKLFQFPSFCRMMTVDRKNNILSRLLNDHATRSCEDVRVPDIPTDELFTEILLSYRLIFGQDDRSWNAFKQMAPTFEEQRGRTSEATAWNYDPLIRVLCGKSCTEEDAQRVYDEIEANDTASYYDPHTEFPFLGKKLMELQKLVNEQQPQTVRALLNDRRDMNAWWTIWNNQVLIFFATFTIFLMLLSLIFQIWQVLLAKQQLRQGSS